MNPKLFAAIATGSVLLIVGCSNPSNLQGKTTPSHSEAPPQPGSAAEETAKSMTKAPAAEKSQIVDVIDVQLSSEKITLDYDKADAGPISFGIQNNSGEPLDVVLLKTDLPNDQIPIKDGKVDTTNTAVKQVGQLITSPLPANGDETIIRTLEPGNYVLMAYQPGKIDMAMTQKIIVQARGI